jgi:hypothetical protein
MAKQLKRMNAGGSSTGFNASTGRKMTPSMVGSGPKPAPSGVDNSYTNTTSGQKLSYKKGGPVVAKKSTMTLARKRK